MNDWLVLAGWLVLGIITTRILWLTTGRDLPGLAIFALVAIWPIIFAVGVFYVVCALLYFLVTWQNPFAGDEDDHANRTT